VRIVAGAFGGRRITAPRGQGTRPTSDRVREALFSILGPLEGVRVLDLFAGSGALGIEALSRGARDAVFVDRDSRAVRTIRANLASLGAEALVVEDDASSYLRGRSAGAPPGLFDLLFLDPPYSHAPRFGREYGDLLAEVMRPAARMVTESDKRAPLELPLPVETERVYGDTRIAVHRGP
jgi:16S rRNA (guanine966-N2)-methyltransferase